MAAQYTTIPFVSGTPQNPTPDSPLYPVVGVAYMDGSTPKVVTGPFLRLFGDGFQFLANLNLGPVGNPGNLAPEWSAAYKLISQVRLDLRSYNSSLSQWKTLVDQLVINPPPPVPASLQTLVALYLADPTLPRYTTPETHDGQGAGLGTLGT
jgi:hypothetical protein